MAKILGSALYFLYVSPTGNWGHGTILIELSRTRQVLGFLES